MKTRLRLYPLAALLLCCSLLGTSLAPALVNASVAVEENAGVDSTKPVVPLRDWLVNGNMVEEDLSSGKDADPSQGDVTSWLQPFDVLVSSASEQVIQITENGFEPSELAFFGPTDVTWINNTSITQTLKSGAAPEIDWVIYLPVIQTSGSGRAGRDQILAQTRRYLTIAAEERYQASLGPNQSYSRRFNTPGAYPFHLAESGAAGTLVLTGTILLESSPSDGEGGVSSTRETIFTFSGPILADTVTADAFAVRFGGQDLPFRINLSPDGTRVTLFYQSPLPGNARIGVTIDGNKLKDAGGMAVDVEGNGVAGGVKTLQFDTLSLTVVPGTSVCGRVFASELDNSRSDVSINTPLQDAIITVDGLESTLRTTSDANGNFCLDPAPAGHFFVHIDGRTATNGVPQGAYYPFVGKSWSSIIGQQTNVGDVFLPLVIPGTLQPVSQREDTLIAFPDQVLNDHPEFEGVSILVPADSLYSDDGTRGGQVGIAPVPPDRLPGELPEGLEFPVVITVQTDGATNFDVPAPICFPNLPDPSSGHALPPGFNSALWSFNHDTGDFEIVGPMRVSDDGQLVCSEPGVGVQAPGWHGTQPGVSGSGGLISDGCGTNDGLLQNSISSASESVGGFSIIAVDSLEMCPIWSVKAGFEGWSSYNTVTSCCATDGTGATPRNGVVRLEACLSRVPKPNFTPLVNGCGAQSGLASWLPVKECVTVEDEFNGTTGEVCFTPACNAHDQCYGMCNANAGHKTSCDDKFLADLKNLCELRFPDNPRLKAKCDTEAATYYFAVIKWGSNAYEKGQSEACFCCPPESPTPPPPPNCEPPSNGSPNEPMVISGFTNLTFPSGTDHLVQQNQDLVLLNGLHYYALRNWYTGEVIQRSTTRVSGYAFDNLALEPNTLYRLYILNAASLEAGHSNFTTPDSGLRFNIPVTFLQHDLSPDTDGDGIRDDSEYIVGSFPGEADSDGDGLSDGMEVQLGLNPIAGLGIQTGIIASSDTPGTAVDVCAANERVAVADSGAGVALFNIFNGMTPTIIAQVDTPGNAQAVACAEDWVAVADGVAGLVILDINSPAAIEIAAQVDMGSAARAVAVADGIAFVGTEAGEVVVVDLASGVVLDRVNLGAAIQDVVVVGDSLFALTQGKLYTFTPLALGTPLAVSASVASPGSIGAGRRRLRLFGGGGILYATHTQGYNTFDISDPAKPILLAQGTTQQFGWKQIVVNGSGLGLAAMGPNSTNDGPHHVSLYDVSDPAQTSLFLTQFETPGLAAAVTLYNGQAYVADSGAGLQVINYRSYESQGSAPTIELSSNFVPGVAEEQALMRLTANTSDDVQVRNVTFYIDQQPVFTDGNYPFEYHFRTPALAQQSSFLVRARATDTGGHETWTNEQAVRLVTDATPPRVTAFSPSGFAVPGTVTTLSVSFNEDLDPATVNAETFRLFTIGPDNLAGTSDDQPVAGSVTYIATTRTASLTLGAPLSEGIYHAMLKTTIKDVAGNGLAGGDFAWRLSIGITIWDGGGDNLSWHDAQNWSNDLVPVNGTLVVIDSTDTNEIIFSQGEVALTSVQSNRPLQLNGGKLTINADSLIAANFNLTSGELSGSGTVTVTGTLTWAGGRMTGSGKTISTNNLVLGGANFTARYLQQRRLENAGTAILHSSYFYIYDSGLFVNRAGAAFTDVSSVGGFQPFTAPANGQILNAGTFTKSGDGSLVISQVAFTNTGTLNIQAGSLNLRGTSTNSGIINLATSTILDVDRIFVNQAGGRISGSGTLDYSSATSFTNDGTIDPTVIVVP